MDPKDIFVGEELGEGQVSELAAISHCTPESMHLTFDNSLHAVEYLFVYLAYLLIQSPDSLVNELSLHLNRRNPPLLYTCMRVYPYAPDRHS